MRLFGVTVMDNLQPRWNLAPSQSAPVIVQNGLQAEARLVSWGLPPAAEGRSFLINARMETVTEKPTFRDSFAKRRCIVPASGWYEWSAPKTPWHVQLSDGGVMGFAGLLLRRGNSDRFVIMTSAADGALASVHHRQPLVLPKAAWPGWLAGDATQARALCVSAPASAFNWYRVSPDVGRVSEDHPGLVTPLDDAAIASEAADKRSSLGRNGGAQGDLFG